MAERAVSARLVCSAGFFVCFVACLCWSAVCIAGACADGADGAELLVVAVACMCASLVSSFGLLLADLVLSVPSSVQSSAQASAQPLGVIRTILVGPMRPIVADEHGPIDQIGPIGPIGPAAGQIIGTRLSQVVFRRAAVFDDSCVAIAVDASPTSATSPKVCVFEPSSPYG